MIILGTNSIKDTGYDVANSCRFDRASTDNMTKSMSDGSSIKGTFSAWIKVDGTGNEMNILSHFEDTNNVFTIGTSGSGVSVIDYNNGFTFRLQTNRLMRDPSAWFHLYIAIDRTQGTANARNRMFINGVEETSFSNRTNYGQQTSGSHQDAISMNDGDCTMYVGGLGDGNQMFGGYMAEVVWLDGTASAVTNFGEFDDDSGIWKPIDVSGLSSSKGTNGFYLDFEDASNLGNDAFGGTDFTETNLAAVDQSTDTCTNNFATWNPLDSFYSSATFSEGNTTVVTPNASLTYATGTVGLSNGRWYFEVQPFDPSDNNNIGIVDHVSTSNSSNAGELQFQPRGWSYRQVGDVYNNNSSVSGSWASYSVGKTIGVFVDLVDNKIYWSRDGVMQNSGTGVTITAAASTDTGFYFPAVGDYVTNDDTTFRTNFGGVSSFAISSGVTDDNGYGTFEYTPSVTVDSTAKKFYAICTKNLAEYG